MAKAPGTPKPFLLPEYHVAPIASVIVQARPGRFAEMSNLVDGLRLDRVGGLGQRSGPFGLLPRPRQAIQAMSLASPGPLPAFDMYAALLDGPTISAVENHPDVQAVYADRIVSILGYPIADAAGTWTLGTYAGKMTFTSSSWIRKVVGADVANASGYDGTGQTVGVVDTGGNKSNPMLTRMRKMTVYPGLYTDEVGHGTHVAAAIGGSLQQDRVFSRELGSTVEVQGMAPGCAMIGIKALGFVIGFGTTSAMIRGIQMALTSGADIINCSFGGPVPGPTPDYDPFSPVFKTVDAAGALAICASGNSGPGVGTVGSPAALAEPLAVGAYNVVDNTTLAQFGPGGAVSNFSSRGPSPYPGVLNKPDFVMPGAIYDSAITGPFPNYMTASYTSRPHMFQALAGTSQAAPIASGLLACMRQAFKETTGLVLTGTLVRTLLRSMGTSPNAASGYGVLTWGAFQSWMLSAYGVKI